MGNLKKVKCESCKKYVNLGKFHPSRESEWNKEREKWLVEFIHDHMNHDVRMVGEYNQFEQWGELARSDEYEEVKY